MVLRGGQKMKLIFYFFFLPGSFVLFGQGTSPTRQEHKEIARIFGKETISEQVDLTPYRLLLTGLLKEADQLFRMGEKGNTAGYMLRTSARGRYENFDYTIFFSAGLSIRSVKVTIYRSSYGAAICHKKWLGQFEGYEGGELILGREIDAISGASISAQSMVEDIQRCHDLMCRLWGEGEIP